VLQPAAGLVDGYAKRHGNQFQMGHEPLEFGSGQRRKKVILVRAMEGVRHLKL
jgi:hypothetical protein